MRAVTAALFAVAVAIMLSACSAQVNRHGHLIEPGDLQQIQPGMGEEQVRMALGTPDTTSTAGGNAYYYISTTTESTAFLAPKITDRRVVAIYFDQFGSVDHVANYGLKDGKVFDFISRKTPAQGGDSSFIRQIFRGIGKPDPNRVPGPQS